MSEREREREDEQLGHPATLPEHLQWRELEVLELDTASFPSGAISWASANEGMPHSQALED